VLDPLQIGFTSCNDYEASLKCCAKRDPFEKVGIVCKKNGKYDIVEYSELSEEQAQKTDGDGLYFELGSILMFMLNTKKLLNLCEDEEKLNNLYHKAFKKIEEWDAEKGQTAKPEKENGYKFELFLHNFLPFCEKGKFGVLKVERKEEFGPVKNADGPADQDPVNDSPASARNLFLDQHLRFLQQQINRAEPAEQDQEVARDVPDLSGLVQEKAD